jgi:DNA-binding transcriptional regulator LsrR (DeoR family)
MQLSPKEQEKLDLAARAAWLYYVAGDTQHEIAQKLQVSRPTAQRLVALALEKGIVKVRVHHPVADCLAIAQRLQKKYNLTLCEVVPSDSDDSVAVLRKLAVTGARVMEQYIQSRKPRIIALSSGRTLKAVIEELSEIDRPYHRFLSLIGTVAHDGSSNRYEVALRIAEKTGSKYFLLPAPLFADSADERRQWCNHRLYRVIEDLSGQADATFVGVGEFGASCPLLRDGFLSRKEVADLCASGAAGEILGWAFDHQGRLLRGPIAARVTSIPLRSPPERPVVAFAAGRRKSEAVRGALLGQLITGLVTDEVCARLLLDESTRG